MASKHLPGTLAVGLPKSGSLAVLRFPVLVHYWVAPFRALGVVVNLKSAIRAFQFLDLLSAVAYLACVRATLVSSWAQEIPLRGPGCWRSQGPSPRC